MAAILLVRRRADIPAALGAVNSLLRLRQACRGWDREDEVHAILVRERLEAGLACTAAACGARPGGAGWGIRDSVSLSGIWSLCWLDGPQLPAAESARERRESTLRLLRHSATPLEWDALFPVLGTEELRALARLGPVGEGGEHGKPAYGQNQRRGIFALAARQFAPGGQV